MKIRKFLCWFLLLLPIVMTIYAYPYLPDEVLRRDGYTFKAFVFFKPVIYFIILGSIPFVQRFFYSQTEKEKKISIYELKWFYIILIVANVYIGFDILSYMPTSVIAEYIYSIIFSSFFILLASKNISTSKTINIKSRFSIFECIIFLIICLILSIILFNISTRFYHYILVISCVCAFFSCISSGLNENGIIGLNSLILMHFDWKYVRYIKITDKKNNIKLYVNLIDRKDQIIYFEKDKYNAVIKLLDEKLDNSKIINKSSQI